jgi:uncharacterized OB-fold protein
MKRTTRLYHDYRAMGLCHQCGKKALPSQSLCQRCKDKAHAAYKLDYAKNPEKYRARVRAWQEKHRQKDTE